MSYQGGGDISSFPAPRILCLCDKDLLYLWTDVFGMAAQSIAACQQATKNTGRTRFFGIRTEIVGFRGF
jgi:hypothetical protein